MYTKAILLQLQLMKLNALSIVKSRHINTTNLQYANIRQQIPLIGDHAYIYNTLLLLSYCYIAIVYTFVCTSSAVVLQWMF